MAIAAMHGRRSLFRLKKGCHKFRTRQAIGHFLSQADWDAPGVLSVTALDILKRLGWKEGDPVSVILDDTQKKKRGKKMDAVAKIFLHAEKVYANGHTILGCAIVYRDVVIPYAVRLWVPKSFAKETQAAGYDGEAIAYKKLTEMASEIIHELPMTNVTVLFDAFYLCAEVTSACEERKYRFVGVVKKNRNFFADGRDQVKLKVGKYGAGVLKRDGRWHKLNNKKHRLAQRVGRLSKQGRVKLVFSRRAQETSWICLATNETRWGAERVVKEYLRRWSIEVLFKDSKQYLGLGDYQVLRYRGIERYLCLVMIAHLLLTHMGLLELSDKAIKRTTNPLELPSTQQLQTQLRSALWDDIVDSIDANPKNKRIAKKLKELVQL